MKKCLPVLSYNPLASWCAYRGSCRGSWQSRQISQDDRRKFKQEERKGVCQGWRRCRASKTLVSSRVRTVSYVTMTFVCEACGNLGKFMELKCSKRHMNEKRRESLSWRQSLHAFGALASISVSLKLEFHMHGAFDRASAKESSESGSDPEEPIGLASDGEVDAELSKLLSEVDEVYFLFAISTGMDGPSLWVSRCPSVRYNLRNMILCYNKACGRCVR